MTKQIPTRLDEEQVEKLERIMEYLKQATFNKTFIEMINRFMEDQETIETLTKRVRELENNQREFKWKAEQLTKAIDFFSNFK